MKFAIFGDIHSNLHALEAVLADAENLGCTQHVCMGDIVGYNAFPCECLAIVRDLDCPTVKGNHDEQASMAISQEGLNPLAEEALDWTRDRLAPDERQWLRELRIQRQVRDFTIVHATLDTPHKWGYITNQLDAAASFSYQLTGLCFVGHTHVPRAYMRNATVQTVAHDQLSIQPNRKYLINVGSVGQPRDGDWRASYCIHDTDEQTISIRRIPYDIAAAQQAILDEGLPRKLAARLAVGR